MDTSKEYIAMCKKAEDDLPHHNIESEDFLGRSRGIQESIWLPRQDQLQAMINNEGRVGHPPYYYVGDLYCFYFDSGQGKYAKTMEQLWLAFVMKELYLKVWDGTDWVNDRE